MKILFILYGDLTSNTANPLGLFAKKLSEWGHECIIGIPHGVGSLNNIDSSAYKSILFDDVLRLEGKIFSGAARADIIHACTPRICIFEFLKLYLHRWPTPLTLYLEDNEAWITQNYLGLDGKQLLGFSDSQLESMIPPALSHPFKAPLFISLADVVILIQEKLQIEVPPYIPTRVIPWGVDQTIFHPDVPSTEKWRNKFKIQPNEKVIVYHGGLNGFTRPAIIDLCKAVEIINQSGIACKLIRTGPNSINFWDELSSTALNFIFEAGLVDRDDLPSILALADVFVQPGRINEFEDLRLPSKVPEFLSMGKPVILPNVNIAHLFVDGEDALILNTGEPIEIAKACISVFNNPKLSKKLGFAARKFAQNHFNIEAQTQKLLSAYMETIGSFNYEQTKIVWNAVYAQGIEEGSFARIKWLLQHSNISQFLFAEQLLQWCQKLNARLAVISNNFHIQEIGSFQFNSIELTRFSRIALKIQLKLRSYLKGLTGGYKN